VIMRSLQLVSHSICALIVLRVNVCFAQADAPVELTWEAPKNCPQEPQVQQQLRAVVGTSSGVRTSPLQAHGTIEPLGERYRLTLFIGRNATHGTRVIESDDCRSLAKAATVVLVLLVQKEETLGRELSESEMSGQPEQPQGPPKASTDTSAKRTAPAEPPKPLPLPQSPGSPSPWHFLLRAPEVSVDFMTLPRTGYGIGLGVGVAYRAWRASVRGTFYEPESITSPGLLPYQVRYRRESLGVLGCHGWRSGLVEVAPCAELTADLVFAHASGDSLLSKDKTAFWISIGSGISGYLHIHRHAALVVMGTGRISTNRDRFLVKIPTGTDQAHRVPLVTLDASLGCEWIF
jgi:hypothetical protein